MPDYGTRIFIQIIREIKIYFFKEKNMNETENKTTTKSNSTKIIAGLVALLVLLFGVWYFVHNRNQVDTHNANTQNVMPDFNSSGNGDVAWNAGATQQAAQPSIGKAQDQTAPVSPTLAATQKASVLFYFDSTELREGQMAKIEEFIKKIPLNYQGEILIEGYTCDIGEEEYNKNLSLKRANAIADLLREKGYQNTKVIPYGESAYPAQKNPARYQYRKVDISVN